MDMKHSATLALAAMLFTTQAYAAYVPPEDADLMKEFMTQAETCQGGHGDERDTWIACAQKTDTALTLVVRGYCLGDEGWRKGKPDDFGECAP
jgi:hypothetical protein